MANSAVLGVMPYPWDREDQGEQTASGGRVDRDLVRKYRYFWGGVKTGTDECHLMWCTVCLLK